MAINHGTRSGYYAHRRQGSTPCAECREAINEYVRAYRRKNGTNRNREGDRIRRKAVNILRDKYREEYEQLVADITLNEVVGDDKGDES